MTSAGRFINYLVFILISIIFISCNTSNRNKNENTADLKTEEQAVQESHDISDAENEDNNTSENRSPLSNVSISADTILGQWIRPDGNYVLEITGISKDKKLEAAYYNPRPINIALAELKDQDGIRIHVEFDDINYRGSFYNLKYDPANDVLSGSYYQATYGQTYQIAFVRMTE
jgi:hypothetical protein